MPVENDGIRNVRQVLWRSIDSLATGTGAIQDRLRSPAIFLLSLGLGLESLPVESRHELDAIRQDLTKVTTQGSEGTIEATLRVMNDDEGKKIAGRILSLYIDLRGGI
jgi:hypothetical protein